MAVVASMPKRTSWDFAQAHRGVTPKGTSDDPRTGPKWSKRNQRVDRPGPGLRHNLLPGELIQSLDVIVYRWPPKYERREHRTVELFEMDVQGTNKKRIEVALKMGYAPVMNGPGGQEFRVARLNGNGLLRISYESQMPPKIEAFSDSETLPIPIAARYLGATEADILKMVASGVLIGNEQNINLRKLNEIRRDTGEVDGRGRFDRFYRRLALQDERVSRVFGLSGP